MFLLFGKSLNPKLRLLLGAAILVLGIVVHLEALAVLGGAFLVIAAFLLVRDIRRNSR
jgi:hypothetical protein